MISSGSKALSPVPSPLHGVLIPLGAALLLAALATDLAYLKTVSTQWETFSIWLITAGLIMAAIAGLALVVDLLTSATRRISRFKFAVFTAVVVLSILNAFVHSRDGYTAVVPTGLSLSALVAALLCIGGWRGWSLNARTEEVRR